MKTVCVITATRAEYGLLYPLIKLIDRDEELTLQLIVSGTHLKKEYGYTKNEIITDVDVSVGTLNSSLVHPREVFIEAIKRSSNKIILIHNHPSGSIEPSVEDKNITKRLISCGEIIGIEVIDHIIIGDGMYFSFKENMII